MKMKFIIAGVLTALIIVGVYLSKQNKSENLIINSTMTEKTLDQENTKTTAASPANTDGVSVEDATAMVQLWIEESRASERDVRGSMEVDLKGDFLVLIKGAFFRYNAIDHTLRISGLVGYDVKTLSKYPILWQELVRTGQREHTTMMYGEASFELVTEQLFEFKPDVILLTKPYTERLTDGRKLGVQISWLLLDANYWFVNRYNEVMAKPEADLIKEAPALNDWMLKNRPRPW